MSWSMSCSGKTETVRESAAKMLENCANGCKSVPVEEAAVRAFATTVDAVCEASPGQAIKVEGNGYAWLVDGKFKQFVFVANIEVIDLA